VSCPETTLIDFKDFNMHVVTPHEFFMALEPSLFHWESRVITDFNQLLPKLQSHVAEATKEIIEEAKA
jgi:diphthamide synthase subunit DPH2